MASTAGLHSSPRKHPAFDEYARSAAAAEHAATASIFARRACPACRSVGQFYFVLYCHICLGVCVSKLSGRTLHCVGGWGRLVGVEHSPACLPSLFTGRPFAFSSSLRRVRVCIPSSVRSCVPGRRILVRPVWLVDCLANKGGIVASKRVCQRNCLQNLYRQDHCCLT